MITPIKRSLKTILKSLNVFSEISSTTFVGMVFPRFHQTYKENSCPNNPNIQRFRTQDSGRFTRTMSAPVSVGPLASHTVTHAYPRLWRARGQSVLLLRPLHALPGGRLPPCVSPASGAGHRLSGALDRPLQDPVFAQTAPSTENAHPSSCLDRHSSRPHPNINALLKSFQLCSLCLYRLFM